MKLGKGLNFFETAGRVRAWFSLGSVPADSALIYEVHSDGAAGKLDGFPTIWWDKITKLSYFFACFNSPYPSRTRGTAHAKGSTFVNDYEEEGDGKPTEWRDTFAFTPPPPRRLTPSLRKCATTGVTGGRS